jgi:hypothetical protein
VARKAAVKAYERALIDGATPDEIIAGAVAYAEWIAENDVAMRYVKLRNRRSASRTSR